MSARPEPYTPADPTTAECPHCGAVVANIAPPDAPGLELASFLLCCPQCGGHWSEYREPARGCTRLAHRPDAA
jgi:hypothetical protein